MIPSRFDLAGGEALTMLGAAPSRAVDGDFVNAGMFKIDENGNISAIGVFVNEDGKETRSELTVSADRIANLTDDYIYFEWCSYFDADGDRVSIDSDEYLNLIVRRSDGLIFSVTDIINLFEAGGWLGKPGCSFAKEDGQGRLLVASVLGNAMTVGRITLSPGWGTWEQLNTTGWPMFGYDYPRLFTMNGGVIATTYSMPSIDDEWSGNAIGSWRGSYEVGVIYPNGGYDHFGSGADYAKYLLLENGLLSISNMHEVHYITIGTSYGQTVTEKVGDMPEQLGYVERFSSWYETSDKVIIKSIGGETPMSYMVYDKTSKTFSMLSPGYDGVDNIELWADNICDGRFYGLLRENGKVSKIVWLDPATLTFGSTDIRIADEIDISTYATDYRNAEAQLTGTRRSDGYKVAVSLNLRKATYNVIFSDPNRPIISLLPLN